jgi:UDP-glucuronate 4-epimerase
MKVLVTGSAGFIGFHTARHFLERGDSVVSVDVIGTYYDPELKYARLALLEKVARQHDVQYTFVRADLADRNAVEAIFAHHSFDRVIHLAAQAGVRYSLENPRAFVESNLIGFANVIEACRAATAPHLTYASSSSVYGANTKTPYSEHDPADHPLQFYAATKRANELMAHAYSHVFHLPTTGLRFFTVYGPWGRPDMALSLFTQKIIAGEPVPLFNRGEHSRDFTFIDDIVEGIVAASDQIATANPAWDGAAPDSQSSAAPWRVFNIGNHQPVKLSEYLEAIEAALGKTAIRQYLPMQAGDTPDTFADIGALQSAVGYRPRTSVREGVAQFVEWYRDYYAISV